MTLRSYLIVMAIATGLSWLAWGLVLVNVSPFETSTAGFLFFYSSLFFALLGTFSLARFAWYHVFSRDSFPLFRYVEWSFRDAICIAATSVALLYLRGQGLLRLWNFLAFFLCIIVFLLFRRATKELAPRVRNTE